MKTAILVLLSILIAVPALAQAPLNGTYKSNDLAGGTMLPGRYSEYWFAGSPLQVNNTVNEQSWDGAALATEWWWFCPWILSPPVLLLDAVDGNGNGFKIWRNTYTDGVCQLDGAGPWGGGDPSYTASIDTWIAIVTETYSNFVEVATVRSVNSSATFIGYNDECMSMQISNTEKTGDTNAGPHPGLGVYPDFWDWLTCTSVGIAGPGEWGDVEQITFTIVDCEVVSTEVKSWGAVKSIYND